MKLHFNKDKYVKLLEYLLETGHPFKLGELPNAFTIEMWIGKTELKYFFIESSKSPDYKYVISHDIQYSYDILKILDIPYMDCHVQYL